MAAVYEAENIAIGKRVAVKILSPELVTSRVVRERFFREARAAAAIRSPYICDVYDVGEFDARPFLVMELLEGESLYDLMSHVRRMDAEQTLKIVIQTAKGLAKAHASHVVHRDLKPENLFLTRNEDGELIAKLLDFGLAKFYVPSDDSAEQVRLTREGALFGTPAYMSPEQAHGKGEVDQRSDLWALGCIVYECLTGQTVWNVDQGVAMILAQVANSPLPVPSVLRPDLSPEFDAWFVKALARDPNERFQTAREFALSLAEVLAPADKAAVQTPSLLVDVDELGSRLSHDANEPLSASSHKEAVTHPQINSAARSSPKASGMPSQPAASVAPGGRHRSGGGLWALLVIAAAVTGLFYGYRSWKRVLSASPAGHSPSSGAQVPTGTSRSPDGVPYADAVLHAQEAIIHGDFQQAFSDLELAIHNGGEGIAKNFRAHLRTALDNPNSPCHLAALAHPRPFTANSSEELAKSGSDVSRPTVIDTDAGTLVGWAQRQVFTTLLDANLKAKDKPIMVAPEAANARHPQLIQVGSRIALLFWNGVGSEPGVFVRTVDAQGRATSPARRVGPIGRSNYSPSLAAAPDGTLWVVWEDDSVGGATNLVARHLDRDLAPMGSVVQLTALKPDRNSKPGAVKPSVAIAAGHLNIAFVLRKQATKKVQWMSIDLGSAELQSGLGSVKTKTTDKDRFVIKPKQLEAAPTNVSELHVDGGTHAAARTTKALLHSDDVRIACHVDYCVAAWNDNMGMQVAYLDPKSGEVIWQKSIGSHGVRATVTAIAGQAAVVWYEPTQVQEVARVQLVLATRSGLNQPSVIAKVSGRDVQPYPEVAPARMANQWYVAWRDYESGRLEAMLARVECSANPQ
jgi:eukaryotic-like serine/threonine-protein kinase